MRAGERAELEELRDAIVNRMNDLQDDVDNGTLTDEQRYAQLREEFGEHYHQTLAEIHDLLHERKPRTHHIDLRTPGFVAGALVLALIASAFLGAGPTGAAALATHTTTLDLALADGQSGVLAVAQPMRVADVQVQTADATTYTLTLEDATGTQALVRDGACVGCEQQYQPPYRLSAQTDGVVHVQRISYEVAR